MKFEDIEDIIDNSELLTLKKRVETLEAENTRLRKVLAVNDLLEEAETTVPVTPEEDICIKGINQILDLVKNKAYDKNDIQNFDILHKNLRMIRGQTTDVKKQKPADVKELLKLVKNE